MKKVAMTTKRDDYRLSLPSVSTITERKVLPDESIVEVSGIVRMADALRAGKDTIKIIDGAGRHHTIIVPPGMMSDIVKPLWDTQVLVSGIKSRRAIELRDIRPANSGQLKGPGSKN